MPLNSFFAATTYEDNLLSLIEQRLAKPPFGDISVIANEKEDVREVMKVARQLCTSEKYSAIGLFEASFCEKLPENPFPINSPGDRLSVLSTLAQRVNASPFITSGQLFAFTVNHPSRGVYAEGKAVARQNAKTEHALFTTVLEEFPEYAKSYAAYTVNAYKEMNEVRAFSPEHPFVAFVIGDANMRITKEVERIFREKKNTIPVENIKIVVVDNSQGVLQKISQVQHKNGPKITAENCDARNIDTMLHSYAGERGVLLTEELLDAFPCEVIQVEGNELFHVCFDIEDQTKPRQVLIPLTRNKTLHQQWQLWCELFPEYVQIANDLGKHKYPNNRIFMNIGMLQMMQSVLGSDFHGKWIGGDYMSIFLERRQKLEQIQSGGVRLMTKHPEDGLPGVNNNLLLATVQRSDMTMDVDYGLFQFMNRLGAKVDFIRTYHEFVARALNRRELSAREVIGKAREIRGKIRNERVRTKADALCRELGMLEQQYTGVRGTWQVSF